jgi:hypothetical protein
MSESYPGLPAVAKAYWKSYGYAAVGGGIATAFAGSFGALVAHLYVPAAVPFYGIAFVSLVIHVTAMYVHDLWRGEYEPEQMTWTTRGLIFALVIVVGTLFSGLLLGGAVLGAVADSVLSLPTVVAAALAAYYPVADVALMRRGLVTPGAALLLGVTLVAQVIFDIHGSVTDKMPVFGQRHRPQP